jgi:pimeloyl-ACP methyl ester carboxylesterase
MSLSFVLIHGGCHGAWCWTRVGWHLRDAGHQVDAIDLPGRDGGPGAREIDLERYVETALAALDRATGPVVVVGHSMGGVTASLAAERRPEAITSLVFVNAVIPENGGAGFPKVQTAGAECALLAPGAMELSSDGGIVTVAPDRAAAAFYHRCEPEDVAWAVPQLGPEPMRPLMTPVRLTPERFGSVPKFYIGSRQDRVLPWWLQGQMSAACGAELLELAADHSPFLSAVDELVEVLLEVPDGIGAGYCSPDS